EIVQTQFIIEDLGREFPTDTLLNQERKPLIKAHLEMGRGNSTQALRLLETTKPYQRSLLFPVAYLRGQAYLNEKKGAEAAAALQEILDHRGWSALSYFYPLSYVGLARAAVLQNDRAKARKAYEDFLALWKDADSNLTVFIDAKKEYEKLK